MMAESLTRMTAEVSIRCEGACLGHITRHVYHGTKNGAEKIIYIIYRCVNCRKERVYGSMG